MRTGLGFIRIEFPLERTIVRVICWGIGNTKNNLKETDVAGSIKEKYDKRSDNNAINDFIS